jgi:hypothetical protein
MVKNIGNIAPTVFNEAALKQINKPYLIEALVVVKANEENLLSMVNNNKKISDSAIQNLEKANSYTDLALLKTDIAKVITSLKELKIEVKLKEGNYDHVEPEQVIDLTPQSLNTNQNLIKSERSELINNKIVKLDSNTPIFSNKTGDRLDEWLFVLNNAFSCLKVTDSIEKLKLATTYVKGPVLQSLIRFQNEDQNADWDGFTLLLKELYEPRNQELMLRSQLRHFRQKDTFANYLNKFQELTNRMVKLSENDKFVAFLDGLSDVYKHEVLKVPTCNTIREAIQICSNYEFCINSANNKRESVLMVSKALYGNNVSKYPPRRIFNRSSDVKNKFSGSKYNLWKKPTYSTSTPSSRQGSERPKYNFQKMSNDKKDLSKIVCFKCKKTGHYSNTCREVVKKINILSIMGNYKTVDSLLTVSGTVDGVKLSLALDSGATASVMAHRIARKFGFHIEKSNVRVKVANNKVVNVIGVTRPVMIDVQGHKTVLEMYILEQDEIEVLLGLDFFMATGAGIFPKQGVLRFDDDIVNLEQKHIWASNFDETEYVTMSDFSTNADEEDIEGVTDWYVDKDYEMVPVEVLEPDQVKKFNELKKFAVTCFAKDLDDLGCCEIDKFHIRVTDPKPIFIPAYRKSYKEREIIKLEVEKMFKAGIIRKSNSPWNSPIILIPKPDGSVRLCVDYRAINKVSVRDTFPLPLIRDVLDRLRGAEWYSMADLRAGFWQLSVAEESIPLTSFSTPDSKWEFTRVPFGLTNSPSHFCSVLHQVLGKFDFCHIYMDDLTIASPDFDTHCTHIKLVLEALKAANLKVNGEKCSWFAKKIKCLGHVVTKTTVSMDPKKVSALKDRLPPTNIKELQCFLGICGYYRRFINNFSGIASPLFQLLQKDRVWVWTGLHQQAFDMMIQCLVSYPVLRHPDLNKPFIVHTDASTVAIAGILSQTGDDGQDYACAYESRILKGAELHYGITELECLSVVFAIKKFRIYLHGRPFEVISDHKALNWLMTIKDPQARLARWAIILQAYDFKITHKPGKENSNVDALSRPVLPPSEAKNLKKCCCIFSAQKIDEFEVSSKVLDVWEDDNLIYFLKFRKHKSGISSKQIRRVNNLEKHYRWDNDQIFY